VIWVIEPASYLLPLVTEPDDRLAMCFGEHTYTYRELAGAAGAVSAALSHARRVGVWATPTAETVVAVVGAVSAGVPAA
jgi:malonyl-CoA/methylmalonyl-CoA synthetase